MRPTLASLQRQLDAANSLIIEMRIANQVLKEQNDFLKNYSSGGMLSTMAITVQRLAETCSNTMCALPTVDRMRRS